MLPLTAGSRVALYGAGASKTVKGGTGSGDVNERYAVSVFEGLKNAGFLITTEEWITDYDAAYEQARQDWKAAVLRKCGGKAGTDFFSAYSTTPFVIPSGGAVTRTNADAAIFVLSRIAGENADRFSEKGDYYLSDAEHQILSDICTFYQKVIVLINTGGVIDLSFLDEFPNIGAVLYISQPGMEGGNAVADVLCGKATPCGKLTDTWAYRYDDYPCAENFSHNNGDTLRALYEEGIYVGYRYFDSFDIPVRYSFGFGLSYTSFSLTTNSIQTDRGGGVTVSVTVTNTGHAYSGKQVVQIYAAPPVGTLEKEARRLVAFGKTKLLAPGETQTLELCFTAADLVSFDEDRAEWLLQRGEYGLFVGDSLSGGELIGVLSLAEDKVLKRTEHICPLREKLSLLTLSEKCREVRHEALMAEAKTVPTIPLNLSHMETVTVKYDAKEPEDEATALVSTLETVQLIALATGDPAKGQGSALGSAGTSVPGSAGETSTCALEQGVANIVLADGPAGLRLNQVFYERDGQAKMLPFEASLEHGLFYDAPEPEGTKRYQFCTAIPVGTLLAQTWDMELVRRIGEMVGDEMRRFGVTLWLAPGMNIHRNPLCGRNFEYYSEDPLIGGKIAASITQGVQSVDGCGTTIKHFCCNNQEDNRMRSDSIVSERALREIYLKGFEIAIRESHPFSIMTSYNLVNGVHAANHYDLFPKNILSMTFISQLKAPLRPLP